MFFKKQKSKTSQSCKIFFKQKGGAKAMKRRKASNQKLCIKNTPFKGLNIKRNPRAEKIKKLKAKSSLLNFLILILLLSIVVWGGYLVINFITSIRGGTTEQEILYDTGNVEGIISVPKYPASVFVYEDRKDEEVVLKMLNQGLSVYRLPRETRSTQVYEYYLDKLPKSDWEFLFTIPTSTEEKLFGQYWFKEENGLRIYVENSDVWYELISKTQAENALSERRAQEIQRKRILESSTEQTLLPDYPWILSIPREYLTRYSSTDLGELQAVEIFEIGGTTKFLIVPIGRYDAGSYDKLLDDFFEKKSKELEEKWEIINTKVDFKKEREVLTARLLIEDKEGEGLVLMNERNFIIYAIISNEEEHPFFEQIINEIHEP
jgi:hypothetical protein